MAALLWLESGKFKQLEGNSVLEQLLYSSKLPTQLGYSDGQVYLGPVLKNHRINTQSYFSDAYYKRKIAIFAKFLVYTGHFAYY